MTWAVEYRSFNPTLDLIRHLKNEMDQLVEKSPYSSFIKLVLTREDGKFYGQLQINSPNRKFETSAKSKTLPEVAGQLLGEINMQLKEWKYLRAV